MRIAFPRAAGRLGLLGALLFGIGGEAHARAQVQAPLQSPSGQELDSLMALARRSSPTVSAAEARLTAARAGVRPAAALPDPMLMAGVVNLPLGSPGFRDEMTMKMIGVEQTLSFPGKRGLRREAALHQVEAAEAELEQVRREAARDVAAAWFDLAMADSLRTLAERQHQLLLTVARAAQAGYSAGRGGQEEPLRVQTELVRLSGAVAALRVERTRALARLNALLGRTSSVPVGPARYPGRFLAAALGGASGVPAFADTSLGAFAAGSGLPSIDTLQAEVLATSPMIRAHLAELAAQSARVDLAAREARPDPTIGLQYGQRAGMTDMVSATVSLPIPLWRGRKQGQVAAGARATLDALEHEHHRMASALEAEVLDLAQTMELHRTRLALLQAGVQPRARAAAEAALAGYRTGRTSFQAVLDTYVALYTDEADAVRLLTEYAKAAVSLESLLGREITS
jgi:outer membrane protein TolC